MFVACSPPLFGKKGFPPVPCFQRGPGGAGRAFALPNDLQPAVITARGGLRPLWLCVPAFQQVCQTLVDLLVKSVQALSRRKWGRKYSRFGRIDEKRIECPAAPVFYHDLSIKTRQVTRQNEKKLCKIWENSRKINEILAVSYHFYMFLTRQSGCGRYDRNRAFLTSSAVSV